VVRTLLAVAVLERKVETVVRAAVRGAVEGL
jgi:hypothetical protein